MSQRNSIRAAVVDDARAINLIYNRFIRESPATFETEEYSDAERQVWIQKRLGNPKHSIFVAETSGQLIGFANASPFDSREGYSTSVKTSVFVDAAGQGKGNASRLYEVLFDVLSETDCHRAYALIVSPNPASVALHQRFGFEHVSTLNEVGRKFGQYHDVMWFEKKL